MENDRLAIVYVATDEKELSINFAIGLTNEDLCLKVCKTLGIGPVARHLFALRSHSTKLWYPLANRVEAKEKQKLDLRLRFKPSSLRRLRQVDERAYDYYFQQARADVMDSKVPDIVYERHKRELMGLGVSDMYRVMLEKRLPRETVESDYKKYIPKECIKRHAFFIKKPIRDALGRISGHDASYVKEQYLKQLESMAPNYPYEEYKAFMDKGQNTTAKVAIRVNGEEVKFCEADASAWSRLCAIEDLCFVSIREDNTVEISRKNGIPSYLKFATNSLLFSFVSALDGYYRLAVKWTFNLCRDVPTPSLEKLHKLKCHGPVGQEFSYSKLGEKRSNKPGSYLLRESELEYGVLFLDACDAEGKFVSRRIEELPSGEFELEGSMQRHRTVQQLIGNFQDPDGRVSLSECLPPSEYDNSPLLICAPETVGSEVAADEEIIASLLEGGPRCVSRNQLQIYRAFSRSVDGLFSTTSGPTKLYRGMWRVAKGKKLEVAVKLLKEDEWGYTKEFLELAGKWAQVRSSALVRLYGLTVTPTIGMLLELVRLGPLDEYLHSSSSQTIKTVDMVEASACLANALWHLEENGVVHGNIRCKKLMVSSHTDNSFVVKLADPGLFSYTDVDVHWIPPEFQKCPDMARKSPQADVWAVGTTIWQIFSRGGFLTSVQDVQVVRRFYEGGKRLPMPSACPLEVYKLMLECWGDKNETRKQPQAIMRDINQILYQVYNSRRTHAYATAFPKLHSGFERLEEEDPERVDSKSLNSESGASSLFTDSTILPWNDTDDGTQGLIPSSDHYVGSTEELSAYLGWLNHSDGDLHSGNPHSAARSENCEANGSLSQMQGIYELDIDGNVILQGRIGQGFYGEVYRGTLERENGKDEPQQVAIKKLKTRALEADIRDFEREIAIMKTLRHPNVVEILGVISEPEVCLVMEFVKHGSLQSYLSINRESLTHTRLLNFALDIATGMDYLGRMSVVHRDLAARNILVADESRVKISDFGLAQVTGKNDYYILQTNRDLPIKWYAPESLRDGKFSSRSDVWSFGVTMYETFGLGEDPKLPGLGSKSKARFLDNSKNSDGDKEKEVEEGSAELLAALESGARLPCPATCPQVIYVKLMYPCWHLQSHQRPDFATLCRDIRDLLSFY